MGERYVDQLMSRPVETVTADTTLRDAAETMIRHDVGAVVVVDAADRLEGLLTTTDFARLAVEGTAFGETTVGAVMRTDVVTTTRRTPVHEVADAMLDHRIHHVPVVDGDTAVGMLSTLDFAARASRSQDS